MNLLQAATILQRFGKGGLTKTVMNVERSVRGLGRQECSNVIAKLSIDDELLSAAAIMKREAGQINVAIHAMGILACLPHILDADEIVNYVSLGAGNTGRQFDLETNCRVAEFKFISWRGGPESIRQNGLFKDFYLLARNTTPKRKVLYVLGLEHPMRFFNGGRKLSSVLSHQVKLEKQFRADFADRYATVCEYFLDHSHLVSIEDISNFVPDLIEDIVELSSR